MERGASRGAQWASQRTVFGESCSGWGIFGKKESYQKRSFRNPLVSLGTFTVKSPTVFQPSGVQVLRLLLEASLDLKVALVMSGFQILSSE